MQIRTKVVYKIDHYKVVIQNLRSALYGSLSSEVGVPDIVARVVEDLKDESESYRRMVMETIEKVVANLGASDIDPHLEELLTDGILYALQEQTSDDAKVMLNGKNNLWVISGLSCLKYVPAREWMRICFELLEMLKAHKKLLGWPLLSGLVLHRENHWLTVLSSVGVII
ncbi:Splicing factor 3B subunit [Artemisia annua]|uniref:Splicing factor 3B subunit n=1 Tax=Artemisia annua TaxID=35608 RepID=A0A2U1MM30_ARTAN|nr:Splicing factor 3B subunit [Artemisia annua]